MVTRENFTHFPLENVNIFHLEKNREIVTRNILNCQLKRLCFRMFDQPYCDTID